MNKIEVYCGELIVHKCNKQLHPVTEVGAAEKAVLEALNYIPAFKTTFKYYSNSPDFVSAVKYIAEKHGVEVEFFLNGVSQGNEIDPIFADFNRALDMIKELGA